ncbi:hypothetical protein MAM1_0174d07264 [Mucor ambiguus]|uniref:Uncharacterized protein n=1 Tax=Mucor ambiguus TaxID=91626 RepID=A0A0C9MB30_9FUNG|nr:hypothetical protein MAM1_0174d07264 [Mucor ambiguus]
MNPIIRLFLIQEKNHLRHSSRSASDSSRQQSGRKMDYIFKTRDAGYGIGCGECGLVGGVNTTKKLQDAGYKMLKVMKDMLYRMAVNFPNVKHKLSICGFYIGENMLKLFILECPVGNVCRYDGFIAVEYPLQESEVRKELSAVLTMIMSGRIIMEEAKKTLDDDESDVVLGRTKPVVMEPSFIPTGINYKKRKQH